MHRLVSPPKSSLQLLHLHLQLLLLVNLLLLPLNLLLLPRLMRLLMKAEMLHLSLQPLWTIILQRIPPIMENHPLQASLILILLQHQTLQQIQKLDHISTI